jgi:hypothetical protein
MRIALSQNNDNGFEDTIILTHIPHPSNAAGTPYDLRFVVEIPNVKCDRCALQAVSVMTTSCCAYPPTAGANSCGAVYLSCANIVINGTGSTTLPKITTLPNIWSNEAAVWSEVGSDYVLDKPYVSKARTHCICSGGSCVTNSSAIGETITPLSLQPATTAAVTTAGVITSQDGTTSAVNPNPNPTTTNAVTTTVTIQSTTTTSGTSSDLHTNVHSLSIAIAGLLLLLSH